MHRPLPRTETIRSDLGRNAADSPALASADQHDGTRPGPGAPDRRGDFTVTVARCGTESRTARGAALTGSAPSAQAGSEPLTRSWSVWAIVHRRRQKKLSKRLVRAAAFGDRTEIDALLGSGACPDACDAEGTTPLYAASVHGAADNVRCLLAAGALPDTESGHGTEGTPLCAAACWGHTETVRALLAHGADPGLREDHGTGHSPLDWAMTGPHPETIAALLAAGARNDHS